MSEAREVLDLEKIISENFDEIITIILDDKWLRDKLFVYISEWRGYICGGE